MDSETAYYSFKKAHSDVNEEKAKNLPEDKQAVENVVEDVDAEVQQAVHQADFEQEEDEEEDFEFQALEKHAKNLEKLNKSWKRATVLAVLGICVTDVLLYQKSQEYDQNMDQADTYLKEAVAHVKDDVKAVRCYYADAIFQTLKANPNQDIVTVTETAIQRIDAKSSVQMPEYQRYVVRKDLMRMAQAYAETNGPRKDFAEILIAYGRGRCGSYVDEKTQPQEVQKNIQAYLKFYASLGQVRENQR